jgi:hypothetical protein
MIEVSPNPKSLPKLFTMIAEVSYSPLLIYRFTRPDANKEPAQAGLLRVIPFPFKSFE